MDRKIDTKSAVLIKNTDPHNINTIIREYSIIRNCSPVLLEILFLLYENFKNSKLFSDDSLSIYTC